MSERTWQDAPNVKMPVGTIGTGELVVTSGRTLYFNAQSNGFNRPEVGLTVRNVRYLVSAHFERSPDRKDAPGTWDFQGETSYDKRRHLYITRAGASADGPVSEPARRTIEAMLLDAVRFWADEHADLLRQGEQREVNNLLMRKEEALAEAEAKVETLKDERAQLLMRAAIATEIPA
jgi:hypothetical protein